MPCSLALMEKAPFSFEVAVTFVPASRMVASGIGLARLSFTVPVMTALVVLGVFCANTGCGWSKKAGEKARSSRIFSKEKRLFLKDFFIILTGLSYTLVFKKQSSGSIYF